MLFVLYRQPKLAAVGMLGWVFVSLFAWHHLWQRAPLGVGEVLAWRHLRELWQRPGARWLLAFVMYMAATGSWVRVAANYRYEIRQYGLLLPLVGCLYWTISRSPRARRLVQLSLMLSLAAISALGCLQALTPIPWLSPINPQIGAFNPSFMGYKNPMALAVLGQIFLVAGYARADSRPWLWRFILVMELGYLATLGSRTSYFALAVAGAYLAVLLFRQGRREGSATPVGGRRWVPPWLGALGLVVVFCGVLLAHPVGRHKAMSAVTLVASPTGYLESDRGIYLRNTLNMALHNPWGVGLGDWQTHYPLYRLHGRDVAFDDRFQVRRAHADHVQFLGEGGWPGAFLWAGFILSVWIAVHRRGWRSPTTGTSSTTPFLAAQWTALAVAMGFDYLLELPYNKFQFFVVLALIWASTHAPRGKTAVSPSGQGGPEVNPPSGGQTLFRGLVVVVALLAMVGHLTYYTQLLGRSLAAASIAQVYGRWAAGESTAWPELQRRISLHGATLMTSPGDSKTLHRDFLGLAHVAMAGGLPERARDLAIQALDHHPHYTPAFRLMGELAASPEERSRWQEGYEFVMERAEDGWRGEYPIPIP